MTLNPPPRALRASLAIGLLLACLSANPTMTLADLDLATDAAPWQAVNDGVMGGVSSSQVESSAAGVRFSGTVRTDYNGGFASARRAVAATLSPEPTAFDLRAAGDGHRYRLVVYTRDARGRAQPFSYFAEFDTQPGQATAHRLPLAQFRATFRGRAVPDAPPLAMGDVIGVGLMLLKDGHRAGRGPFDVTLMSLRTAPGTR
ncbi:MAG: CIA30 family protein [Burkholderiaceae bacterium]|nr:CIA30 family protein [Burkholderiaceae bacterium]